MYGGKVYPNPLVHHSKLQANLMSMVLTWNRIVVKFIVGVQLYSDQSTLVALEITNPQHAEYF